MDFEHFTDGLPKLTKTERRIFDCYAAGMRSREIMEQLEIKDSTLRFHNRNIYTKLGINSLKQLQQCIAVLHSDGTGTALPEPPHEAAEPENKEDELPMTDCEPNEQKSVCHCPQAATNAFYFTVRPSAF